MTSYSIPVQIDFKSLHREIQFAEVAWQKSFDVTVRMCNFVYLSLVGNNIHLADEMHTNLCVMNINEDDEVYRKDTEHWVDRSNTNQMQLEHNMAVPMANDIKVCICF